MLVHCIGGVDWAKQLRAALIKRDLIYAENCTLLSSLATEKDINDSLGAADNFGPSRLNISSANFADRRPPSLDNRHLGGFGKQARGFAKPKANPFDKRTGKPMVCCSEGFSLTEHL